MKGFTNVCQPGKQIGIYTPCLYSIDRYYGTYRGNGPYVINRVDTLSDSVLVLTRGQKTTAQVEV